MTVSLRETLKGRSVALGLAVQFPAAGIIECVAAAGTGSSLTVSMVNTIAAVCWSVSG